jgi:hypothetical protein
MRVKLYGKSAARRVELENSGYTRTGDREVTAPLSDAHVVVQDDDLSIKRVTLHRNDSDGEAQLIDGYVKAGVPENYRKGKIKQYTYRASRGEISVNGDTVIKSSVNELRVERLFERVLVEQEIIDSHIHDDESFYSARRELVRSFDEEIQELQTKIEELQESTIEDHKP